MRARAQRVEFAEKPRAPRSCPGHGRHGDVYIGSDVVERSLQFGSGGFVRAADTDHQVVSMTTMERLFLVHVGNEVLQAFDLSAVHIAEVAPAVRFERVIHRVSYE